MKVLSFMLIDDSLKFIQVHLNTFDYKELHGGGTFGTFEKATKHFI